MRISKKDKEAMAKALSENGMDEKAAEELITSFESGAFNEVFAAINEACKKEGPSMEEMTANMERMQEKLDEMSVKLAEISASCEKNKTEVKAMLRGAKDAVLQTAGSFSLSVWNKLDQAVEKAKGKVRDAKDTLYLGLIHLKNKVLVFCKENIEMDFKKTFAMADEKDIKSAKRFEKFHNGYADTLSKAGKKLEKAIDSLAFGTKAAIRALEQSKGDLTSLVEKKNALEGEMQDSVRDIQQIGADLSNSEMVQTASRIADIGMELDGLRMEIADKEKEVKGLEVRAESKTSKLADIKQSIQGLISRNVDKAYDKAAIYHDKAIERQSKMNEFDKELDAYKANHPTGFEKEAESIDLD